MREFKFRAWNEKIKWMSKPFTFGQALNFHDQIIKSLSNEEILMQFTGLTDKNGTDIYDGDIVKCGYGIGKIIFKCGCFMVEWLDDKESLLEFVFSRKGIYKRKGDEEFEIIGNIYQNPELL